MGLKEKPLAALKKLDRLSPRPALYTWLMSRKERSVFDRRIRDSKVYLEFGSGGSTLRAVTRSKAKIYSVESDPRSLDDLRKYKAVSNAEQRKRLFLFHCDIGPTKRWGYPASGDCREQFPDYSSGIFKKLDPANIDVALVDGRFRAACLLQIILKCGRNSGMKILCHDFWDRPYYHAVLKYLDVIEKADTLGVFAVKRGADLKAVERDNEEYKFDPR